MHRLFTIFLTTLLAVHAIFHCCVHHGHDHDGDTAQAKSDDLLDGGVRLQQPQHRPHRFEGDICDFGMTSSSVELRVVKARAFLPIWAAPPPAM